ncbi:MAG: SDR family NAD(P)-dependent oxidoreductase [Pseudomonadota bacterium]
MNKKSLQKAVLITGCSSGIGYQTAKDLQMRGYDVIATARKQEDVKKLNSEGLFSLQLDLSDSNSIKEAFAKTLGHTNGTLYGLFNNGAYGQAGAVEDLSRETIKQQFETNVFGWIELTNLAIPIMRSQGAGRIIYNSSILGLIALKFRGAYNASKFAIEGFADTLRLELNNTKIFISLIEPGPIESKFRQNSYEIYMRTIDRNNSAFKDDYFIAEQRLQKQGAAVPFTLPAEAVSKKVLHALESNKPKPRYYVTFPTYLFAYLKRFLPHRILDKILIKISNN